MSKHNNGNGRHSGGKSISPAERAELLALDRSIHEAKLALADADIDLARAESRRNELRAQLARATESMQLRVVATARAHGIDVSATGIAWHLDLQSGRWESRPKA